MFNSLTIYIAFSTFIVLASCSSPKICTVDTTDGNIGATFNSSMHEFSPFIFDGNFYYHRVDPQKAELFQINKAQIIDGVLSEPVLVSDFPNEGFEILGSHFISRNPKTGDIELFFSASISNKNYNSDLFKSTYIKGKWSRPSAISELNTVHFESMPFVSENGDYLVFVSDRPDSYGGLDIYISTRNDDGPWSTPRNAGAMINSEANEINPTFQNSEKIIFASNRDGYFNLYGADLLNQMNSTGPTMLKSPMNSLDNEFGAFVHEDMIYVVSDRLPSCGNGDIFLFKYCGPVILDVVINPESAAFPTDGFVRLLDKDRNFIMSDEIKSSKALKLEIFPNKQYIIQYFNKCIPQYVPEQRIIAPCSDSSIVRLRAQFVIPRTSTEFDFGQYDVPFFVTGYYHPNTIENLEMLRKKFANKSLGKNDSTKYIENPGEIYDGYAKVVDNALDDAIDFINNILNSIDDECAQQNVGGLSIKIIGFADPRPLSPIATYVESNIDDEEYELQIERGTQMDNELLSKLRAYYTAKYLDNKLSDNPKYNEIRSNINWGIEGRGIDTTDLANELKRRVSIEIGVFEN